MRGQGRRWPPRTRAPTRPTWLSACRGHRHLVPAGGSHTSGGSRQSMCQTAGQDAQTTSGPLSTVRVQWWQRSTCPSCARGSPATRARMHDGVPQPLRARIARLDEELWRPIPRRVRPGCGSRWKHRQQLSTRFPCRVFQGRCSVVGKATTRCVNMGRGRPVCWCHERARQAYSKWPRWMRVSIYCPVRGSVATARGHQSRPRRSDALSATSAW